MPKTKDNTHELVEADFKQIRKLIIDKYDREYTTEYIRKVCKGDRSNSMITAMALDYIELKKTYEAQLNRLAS